MIPKIIHCCWFGGTRLPKAVQKYLRIWRKRLPNYEIKIWTEQEFDITQSNAYVKQAYECKKFAFVSDYVRLYALYKYGGIYLDTDVEVLKSFDSFLHHSAFMCFEDYDKLSTAIIATEPNADWVWNLLQGYEERVFLVDGRMDLTTNVEYITGMFKQYGLKLNGEKQSVQDVVIYPSEYFSPKSWGTGKYTITDNTVTVHHFAGTWHSPLTRFLSIFFSNKTIIGIAAFKEKLLNSIKNVRA